MSSVHLSEVTVSIDMEIMDAVIEDAIGGKPVTITLTGDTGPNGHPMGRIAGTVPVLMEWLSTVGGLVNEDILAWIPNFRLDL